MDWLDLEARLRYSGVYFTINQRPRRLYESRREQRFCCRGAQLVWC
jgi:hypothetical protein